MKKSILESDDVEGMTLTTGYATTVKTGQDSSMTFHSDRSITIRGPVSEKRQRELMKEMFLCCVEDVLPQAEFAFEQFDQTPVKPWPEIIGEAARNRSPKLDEVKREE